MKNIQKVYITDKELPNLILLTLKQNLFYFVSGVIFIGIISATGAYLVYQNTKPHEEVTQKRTTQPQSATPPTVLVKTYTVQEGEGLWQIAEKEYGNGEMMNEIIKANNLPNPDQIAVGEKIILPHVAAVEPTNDNVAGVQTSQVVYTKSTYVVQEGEDLWDVAVKAYGDGNAWHRIAKANNIDNPDMVNPGTKLKLPR